MTPGATSHAAGAGVVGLLRAVGLLAAYVGAVTWITWPLGARIGEAIPGAGPFHITDVLYSMWAMGWSSHALLTAPATLPQAGIYHPTPDALFYGPSAFGGVPLFAPVVWATRNPVLATNVVFLGGIALTAWTTHLVVRSWTGSDLAGLVAATTILTNTWLVRGFVAATPHIAALQFLPVIAWAAAPPLSRLRDGVRLVPLVVLQSLTDCVYIAPAVFAVLGTLAVLRLLRRRTRAAGLRLLVALGVAAVVLLPLYAAYQHVREANPDIARQSVYPTRALRQMLPDEFFDRNRGPAVFLPATLVLVGLGLVAIARRRPTPDARRVWCQAGLWTALGMVISLGPRVSWRDQYPLPVPQQLVMDVYTHLRVPARLGVVAMVGAALLSGLAFTALARWCDALGAGRRVVSSLTRLALAVVVVVALVAGWGTTPLGAFAIYDLPRPADATLARLRMVPGPLLEIPVPVEFMQGLAMYHALFHEHPVLNGYSSYYPAAFPGRMALARQLPDAAALGRLRADTGLGGIWLHLDRVPLDQRAAWLELATHGRGDLVSLGRNGMDIVFVVRGDSAPANAPVVELPRLDGVPLDHVEPR